MIYVFLTLFSVALVLYILSFFAKSRIQELEEQMEEISLNAIQETYQLKKKMRVLEEELLIDEAPERFYQEPTPTPADESESNLMGQKVLDLYQEGFTTKEIADKTSMKEEDIFVTLRQYSTEKQRGVHS
ncbi:MULTISPECIES: hypothetical protein [Pontibacillus]|uniref:Resolvase HTH domain-containing protein n=1 Tax=Pontibacillus chungwhensis TaxID=265426 RepID=A0ABY8UTE6_9BACI|nr:MULTISPECIES: hypothetical protein [Pontibacillus]MCD5323576.1 hypothetical protein [Pontibacillus sp. HN14]WIF96945.1 hypothetical protein QNI29_14475 [Pontibacillus chungwhensis]